MKAVTFHGVEDVRVETVPDPSLRGPGDAIVRVERAGICGSDLHVYHGRETGLDAGTVLGHELVGEIVEAGPEVGGLRSGDRVVAPFTTSCGRCYFCRGGLTARCVEGGLLGWVERGVGLQGAQAELVRVPLAGSTLVRAPGDLAAELLVLAGDVIPTGLHAARQAGIAAGRSVAVLGCGPVGLAAVLAARARGAERLWAVDGIDRRLELARRFGAEALDLRNEPRAAILEATQGRGADSVIEAVGSPQATRLALELVRPGGTIAAVGVHTEEKFSFSPGEAYDKNLTYRAGRCPARGYIEPALQLIRERAAELEELVSHRLPLAGAPRAYRLFAHRLEGCTKAVLSP